MLTLPLAQAHSAMRRSTTIDVRGSTVHIAVSGAAGGGAGLLVEWRLPPYWAGLPLQRHVGTQTVCYVLEGTLAFMLEQHMLTAGRGERVVVTGEVGYRFFNPAAASARLLMWCVPGAVEHYRVVAKNSEQSR